MKQDERPMFGLLMSRDASKEYMAIVSEGSSEMFGI